MLILSPGKHLGGGGGLQCFFFILCSPFSSQVKPLFRSSTAPATSAHVAPQTYAEYAITQPPGGAGATVPAGSEPSTGENPNQTLKTGTKSNSIIVSPRQVRVGEGPLEVLMGKPVPGVSVGSGGRRAEVHTLCLLVLSSCIVILLIPAFVHSFIPSYRYPTIHALAYELAGSGCPSPPCLGCHSV